MDIKEYSKMPLEDLRAEYVKLYKEANKLTAQKSLNSLYDFNRLILKADEGEAKVPLAPFHKELCQFVQDSQDKKKLVLVPRLHLKSTLVTIGYTLFRIIHDPNIRILIMSGTYDNAVSFVGAIKDHLSRNDYLKELFGNIAANPVHWANDRFTLSTARTSLGDKEPTVLGVGVESNIVSKHFNMIIMDDIVTLENSQTIEQRDKVARRYRDAINLLEVGGQMIVIGTRWHEDDLYSSIAEPTNPQRSQFEFFTRRAMEWDGPIEHALREGEGFISSLWPEKFNAKELRQRFDGLGPYEFSSQYLNDVVIRTDAVFRRDWFHPYEETDIQKDIVNNYITVDPAISMEREADYTAIVVSGMDRYGALYVRDIVRERLGVHEIIDNVFRLNELWHPKHIGIEDVAYQKALLYSIREEMRILNSLEMLGIIGITKIKNIGMNIKKSGEKTIQTSIKQLLVEVI